MITSPRTLATSTLAVLIAVGVGRLFYPSGSGPGYVFLSAFGSETLSRPVGVAVFEDRVYVADTGNDRVVVFSQDGLVLGDGGKTGAGEGQFRRPTRLATDSDGNVYVADLLNHRVQKFSKRGRFLRAFGKKGLEEGSFLQPAGVAVGNDGSLYVVEFAAHRVQKLSPDGKFVRAWGDAGSKGLVSRSRFNYPADVAVADNGHWWVSDTFNDRVKHFAPDGRRLSVWGGFFGLNVPGSWRGWFKGAYGMDVTATGDRVFVTDFGNHRVQVFGPDGTFLSTFGVEGTGPGQFRQPTDVTVGPRGRLYVVDYANNRIQVWQEAD